ncbi:MAG: tetratricopeptide repeat protein, partial [Thermoanaerobaculia bacterium]|nr:tetratricopeptide repeat protein [Thermoanaerobaculia bacterium]
FTSAERAVQVFGCYVAGGNFNQLPPGEQRRRAIEFVQQRQVLLVWDNFESTLPQFNDAASPYTDDERRRLAELFADLTRGPGRGALLVTCRPGETGLPGARRHELLGLARADSLWLLAGIVQRNNLRLSDPRLRRERLAPLLDDLADHPLSVELVGPHLKTLTPEAIRADFAQLLARFEQAAPAAPHGGKGRNSSLLASLEFSRRHLSAAAQDALPWLGLFRGGVFEDNLLEVSQLRPEDWQPIRDELQGIALVRVEDEFQIADRPFLRFHPTLAAAAADDRLAQQPETRQRFIDVYGAVMQMLDKALAGSQSRAALAILDREEANYRCAVRWAIGDGRIREAAGLGETFSRYLQMSNRLRERDAWVTMLRDATRQGAFTAEAAYYERQAAWTRFQQGDPQGAVAQLQALIERLRSTSEFDPASPLAKSVLTLGRVHYVAGASSQAIPILRDAVGLWEALVEREAGQSWQALLARGEAATAASELGNLSATLGDLANALRNTGRHDDALAVAETGLRIDTALGNQRNFAAGHGQCASILKAAGRYDDADARYDLARAAARDAGDQELEGTLLQHQGGLAGERGQFPRAVALHQQALRRFQAAGDQAAMMKTYNLLGVVEQNAGRLPEARAWYEKSRQVAVALKDQRGLGEAAHNLGIVCQEEGEAARAQGDEAAARRSFETALASVGESLRIGQALRNQPGEAASLSQLAIIHLHLGDLPAAERRAEAAREIRESLGLNDVWKEYNTLSKIAAARQDPAAASDWAQKRDAKLAEVERLAGGGGGVPTQMLQALQALTLACAQAGFGGQSLDPGAAEALCTLDGYPAPFPIFSAALRQLAAGQLPAIPGALPGELQQILTTIVEAIRQPTQN